MEHMRIWVSFSGLVGTRFPVDRILAKIKASIERKLSTHFVASQATWRTQTVGSLGPKRGPGPAIFSPAHRLQRRNRRRHFSRCLEARSRNRHHARPRQFILQFLVLCHGTDRRPPPERCGVGFLDALLERSYPGDGPRTRRAFRLRKAFWPQSYSRAYLTRHRTILRGSSRGSLRIIGGDPTGGPIQHRGLGKGAA